MRTFLRDGEKSWVLGDQGPNGSCRLYLDLFTMEPLLKLTRSSYKCRFDKASQVVVKFNRVVGCYTL